MLGYGTVFSKNKRTYYSITCTMVDFMRRLYLFFIFAELIHHFCEDVKAGLYLWVCGCRQPAVDNLPLIIYSHFRRRSFEVKVVFMEIYNHFLPNCSKLVIHVVDYTDIFGLLVCYNQ